MAVGPCECTETFGRRRGQPYPCCWGDFSHRKPVAQCQTKGELAALEPASASEARAPAQLLARRPTCAVRLSDDGSTPWAIQMFVSLMSLGYRVDTTGRFGRQGREIIQSSRKLQPLCDLQSSCVPVLVPHRSAGRQLCDSSAG